LGTFRHPWPEHDSLVRPIGGRPVIQMNLLSNRLGSDTRISIVVPSWDGYHDVWRPFFKCFFDSWPDCPYPIFLGTGEKESPDARVSVIKLGEDSGYSDNLSTLLSRVPSQWMILWTEDLLIQRKVRSRDLSVLIEQAMELDTGYLRLACPPLSLTSLACRSPTQITDGIWRIPKGTRYRVGITVGLWKKTVLSRLLRAGESAWDLEIHGSKRSDQFSEEFLTINTETGPISLVNGVWKGSWTWPALRLVKEKDLEFELSHRGQQGWLGHVRHSIYGRARYLAYRLGFLWMSKHVLDVIPSSPILK